VVSTLIRAWGLWTARPVDAVYSTRQLAAAVRVLLLHLFNSGAALWHDTRG
jgi:hypothetical protein